MSSSESTRLSRRDFVHVMAGSTLPLLTPRPLKDPSEPSRVSPPPRLSANWPVLRTYEGDKLRRIALPVGGIGTGTVSLGGRGDFRDWEIVNRPAKGFVPAHAFFALYARPSGGAPVTRVCEGPLPLEDYEGAFGVRLPHHGLPRFETARFAAAYPFGQVALEDPEVPLAVRIEAFNPLVPGDADASGLPIAAIRFVLENRSGRDVEASVCGNLQNFIGTDGHRGKPARNRNVYREGAGARGLYMASEGVDRSSEQWGSIALVTTGSDALSHRVSWGPNRGWNTQITDFWDDFGADGQLTDPGPAEVDAPVASLAVRVVVPAGASRTIPFLLAWFFPNRQSWTPEEQAEDPIDLSACEDASGTCCEARPDCVGNYYATRFADAWDAAERAAATLTELEEQSLVFVRSFVDSDLPLAVREAALFNLSTLRCQTTFRTADGRFFGFEGCGDDGGCCHGSCTHVWNYEQATAFLFGDLAKSMRETEFLLATDDKGLMSFRVNLPIERAQRFAKAAADGQMGCLMKLYRDWQLSGDRAWLERLWPHAKAAMSFPWIEGGWDADADGVMEGAQHNTMDVEYFGPNPQMQVWYLGALRAAEEMARALGDEPFASRCRAVFESGRSWTDAHLFNGEYYEHDIRPPMSADRVAPALLVGMGSGDLSSPDFQLGRGCLVDQLVGQFLAHVCGLGHLTSPTFVRTTLASIMKYNFQEDLSAHFNNMRTFALGSEAGLLMATYPKGERPTRPFPYYNEIMTGFEYAAAVHMLYEGLLDDGLRAIAAIRDRYDGERRNPFNEAECGNHYARAMASWGAVLALTGFRYSGVTRTITFAASKTPVRWFWSTGHAWGTAFQEPVDRDIRVRLLVNHGVLVVEALDLPGAGVARLPEPRSLASGDELEVTVPL